MPTESEGVPDRLRLTPLEELWVVPIGTDEEAEPLPEAASAGDSRAALEEVVLAGLLRPPCLVSFSGGVDSSTVLALAAHVARRESLPPPIPATNWFPCLEEAEESRWQEQVIGHLRLGDWLRLEWREDELDILGPLATDILERHGILVPFNSHFHYPLLERATGGSLLTGIGGDELFETVRWATAARIVFARRRPRIGDLPALALGLAPRRARAMLLSRRRSFSEYHWIRDSPRRDLTRAYAQWESRSPLRWDRSIQNWWWPSRALQSNRAGKRALADDFDVMVESPLSAPTVLAACAHAGGALGLGTRAQALGGIVGDLLPRPILERRTKASFNGAFWGRHAHAFVERWDGRGIDPESVDEQGLRQEWSKALPDAHSFAQLQRAWLASRT
jgi:hypothetical protein